MLSPRRDNTRGRQNEQISKNRHQSLRSGDPLGHETARVMSDIAAPRYPLTDAKHERAGQARTARRKKSQPVRQQATTPGGEIEKAAPASLRKRPPTCENAGRDDRI
ncbi:hypothetical protein SCOCK_40249 [Actinacidiphila cocklensis]|uniref:Uncharacterized protein n=1 Tax=Actinacidiphila cocklensis TaxID=887465 RepID=A0A9W4DVP2_9ACTN|nr:hypothetical protein SCOCK_40249 [Actinacidiphila cocklensis]